MADIRSKGSIRAGRDIQVADNGATIRQHTQKASEGGRIHQPPTPKSESPILRITRGILDIAKQWFGGKPK